MMYGNGKLEVAVCGSGTPTWMPVGSLKSISSSIERQIVNVESSNAVSYPAIQTESMSIKAECSEILRSPVWDLLLGTTGKSTTTGTPVTGAVQAITATAGVGYPLAFQNADNSEPTITACVTTPALTAYTGYTVSQIGTAWFVEFAATGTYQLTMNYTPAASITYTVGSEVTPPLFQARITTKSVNGTMYFVLYNCANKGNLEMKFQSDTAADKRLCYSLDLCAYPDTLYHVDSNNNALLGYINAPFIS